MFGANPKTKAKQGRPVRMIRNRFFCAAIATIPMLGLGGCDLAGLPKAPAEVDLRAEAVRGDKPIGPKDACWASDETPAIIETITEQIAEDAAPDRDAGFRTETVQAIIQPREQIWFRTPCEDALTVEVISTLQRALAARGFYKAPQTGELDPATRSAIRAYQLPRGLNSDRLSLAAARDLGVVPADFGQNTAG